MKNREEVLKNIPIFKRVKPETLKLLAEIARPVDYSAGQVIIREGDAGSCMFILVEGTVRITKSITLRHSDPDAENIEKNLATLSGEDFPVFGEMSLLEDDLRTATVTALTDVELLCIERDDFQKAASRDYESVYHVVMEIARIVSSRLRATDRDVVKLTTVLGVALSKERGY